jgi:NAD(P)-dependent dehydrogenase (short-subunit alcohol dehydrogenase family)
MPLKPLDNRTAVITGGASGIGLATACLFAEKGARVFIGDYELREENRELFQEFNIQQMECDVQSESDIKKLIDSSIDQGGGHLDILVNNAGVVMVNSITEIKEEDWDRCIDTNLKGPFFGCKHAIHQMQKQETGGSIINVSSNAGILPRKHDPVYSISKMALIALTKSLALCHAPDRIRINAVCPGPVSNTGIINADLDEAENREKLASQFISASPIAKSLNRMITPEEIARSILYLASDDSEMITGTSIAIDGGKSLGVHA